MKPRYLICIPIYNNESTICDIIEKCLATTAHPIVIVDDGSDLSVEQLFLKTHLKNERISFLRHEKNLGKGVALQIGFRFALQNNYTHVISIDADGQHQPNEIIKLTQAADKNPFSLVIGDREMKTAHVPSASAIGKVISNFWVKYETDAKVADSQSGFRCYPIFFLQSMKFFCKKYDFEIEVLIRLIWAGVPVQNVKISVVYFPPGKRITHFHKIKDNARLTLLNIGLVIVSLVTEQTSPVKSALAFAIGVFVGVLPIFGLHTAVIAGISFLFRLNFIYLWMGIHISAPPLIPLVVYGSNLVGKNFFQHFYHHQNGFATTLTVGSVILGFILAVLFFIVVYAIKKKLNQNKNAWTGKDRNQFGVAILRFILKKTGLRFTYFLLNFVALYYYLVLFHARKSINQYWETTSLNRGFLQRQKKTYQLILVFAKTLADRAYQKIKAGEKFKYELDSSAEDFSKSFESKKNGVVIIASHVGGWELAMSFFLSHQSQKKMIFVMHKPEQQSQHHSIDEDNMKAEIIYYNKQAHTVLKLKEQLNQGQFVGLMGDRPVTKNYEQKLFFNQLAQFDTTGLRIALACDSEIRFVFSFKTGLLKYKIFAIKAIVNSALNQQEKLDDLLQQYIDSLEKLIKIYPEQWFNFFPFWSAPPLNSEIKNEFT